MRHLVDSREPITTADIDAAVNEAAAEITAPGGDQFGLTARLLAIVADAYGYEVPELEDES